MVMPRKLLKRYTPDPETVRQHKHLRWLARFLEDPNLFHMNRRSVSGAFAAGLFWAMIPMPLQMLAAAVTAIVVRINLPIAVALVWLTNPITMPPVFYFNYVVGTWFLGAPKDVGKFQMSLEWISAELGSIWLPLYVGSVIVGLVLGLLGYVIIRGYWRWHIVQTYRRRFARRHQRASRSDRT
jgi:hypothetical protein